MKIHNLKILPEYFVEVRNGNKTFEIRKNDRDFKVNDVLRLREWDSNGKCYSGKVEFRTITYITNYMQQEGYVVLGIKPKPE